MFKVGDIVKVKEGFRELFEQPFHLYKVIEVRSYSYDPDDNDYVIRSINDRTIQLVVSDYGLYDCVEKVQNFCTMFPDLCLGKKCCFRHDKRWIRVGSKLKADLLLYRCVKKQALKCDSFVRHIPRLLGVIMFLGVNTPVGFYFYYKAQRTGIMQ